MSALERLDRYQRAHSWLGFPLGVIYKFFDDRGTHQAATVSYYGFVALFPLLLLFFSAAGFFLQGDPTLRRELETSALKNVPVIGSQLQQNIGSFHGSTVGIVVGVIGLLYGGTGVMQAAQAGFNRIYGVPRNEQPNPIKSRVRSLALLAIFGSGVLISAAITVALSTANGLSSELAPPVHALGYVLSFVLALGIFMAAFQLLTAYKMRWRQVVRGGLLATVFWELLQIGGADYVSHVVHDANKLYGTFALVLGVIAWIYLQALAAMLAAEINVVLAFRLWPRALLTPFTDDVVLTPADRRAYALYAGTERFKGFERIHTTFAQPSQPAEEHHEPVEKQRGPVAEQREPVEAQRETVEEQHEPVEEPCEPIEPLREPVAKAREPVEEPETR